MGFDLKYLWPRSEIDEELCRYYVETSLKMLESRLLIKEKPDIRNIIFGIIETVIIMNKNSIKNIQIKLINLIYEEETLIDNVVDLI